MNGIVFAILQLPDGRMTRLAPVAEVERMRERGECRRLRVPGKKCIGKARPVYRLIEQVEPSFSRETPAAITSSDIEASLGMLTWERRKQARQKIRAYPGTH